MKAKMTLPQFSRQLLKKSKQSDRPFVCCGSPLDCEVFIVGINPATKGVKFWDYFNRTTGFDKSRFLDAYTKERQKKTKKTKKTRRSPTRYSQTRYRIERVIRAAAPVRCLETNIYSACSTDPKNLTDDQRNTECFDFLLRTIKPKLIVCHGVLTREALPDGGHLDVRLHGEAVRVLGVGHLSRMSYANAERLGRRILKICRP